MARRLRLNGDRQKANSVLRASSWQKRLSATVDTDRDTRERRDNSKNRGLIVWLTSF
jgi:hypothetical protein